MTGDGDLPPEQLARRGQVAGGDRAPDVAAADGAPVERERRDDHDVKAVTPSELGERLGRAASLEPERRIGGHEEAREVHPRADRAHERVVGRAAHRLVEVLDDRDGDAGGLEEVQALGRMEQERRRRAADDFVGMVVERDHRRASVALGGLPRELVQEVRVSRGGARRTPR